MFLLLCLCHRVCSAVIFVAPLMKEGKASHKSILDSFVDCEVPQSKYAKLDSMLTDREIIVEDVDSQMGPNADPEDASVRSNLENFGIDAFMLVFTFLLSSFPDLVFFCGLGHNQCLSAMPSRKNDSRKPRKESSRQLLKKKRR